MAATWDVLKLAVAEADNAATTDGAKASMLLVERVSIWSAVMVPTWCAAKLANASSDNASNTDGRIAATCTADSSSTCWVVIWAACKGVSLAI